MLFDIGATELLAIVIIAIVVIGPKELPMAMRTVGRWVSQARRLVGQFRTSLDSIAHEAEMEALEKKWAEQNAQIMKEHGGGPAMLPMDGTASHAAPQNISDNEQIGDDSDPDQSVTADDKPASTNDKDAG